MHPAEREQSRRLARAARLDQGRPLTIEDPETLAKIAALVATIPAPAELVDVDEPERGGGDECPRVPTESTG